MATVEKFVVIASARSRYKRLIISSFFVVAFNQINDNSVLSLFVCTRIIAIFDNVFRFVFLSTVVELCLIYSIRMTTFYSDFHV